MLHQSLEKALFSWASSNAHRMDGEQIFSSASAGRCSLTQQGDTEIFATKLQATRWLHTKASERGCSAIEIRHADGANLAAVAEIKVPGVVCRLAVSLVLLCDLAEIVE